MLILGIISPLMIIAPNQSWKGIAILGAVCLGAYVVTRVAAYNAAVRLVGNVIARKLTSGSKPARTVPKKPSGPKHPKLQE